ncbi:MAG: DUF4173 domain-containing protein, partial [Bacteroidota bacterium]
RRLSLATIGILLYHFLFWQAGYGINLWFFSTFLMVTLLWCSPEFLPSKKIILLGIGTFLTGGLVVWHHSLLSQIVHLTSFVLFTGFVLQPRLRCLLYGLLTSLTTLLLVPQVGWRFLRHRQSAWQRTFNVSRWGRLLVAPLCFSSIFLWMFRTGNDSFLSFTNYLGEQSFLTLSDFLLHFSWSQVGFTFLGFLIIGTVFSTQPVRIFTQWDIRAPNYLYRRRLQLTHSFKMLALKSELLTGLLLMGLVNTMLLLVNYFDITLLWFKFDYSQVDLSAALHEGTYQLIASILLSMGILLYFFRCNLNFYQKNQWLKRLAYLWILQNFILIISVGLRTYYYIYVYGLAYKRIGMLVFLLLTLFGLFTLWQKISYKHSFSYLLRQNLWATYLVFVGLCGINWDGLLVRYNLAHPHAISKEVDASFLLARADHTLFMLYQQKEKLSDTSSEKRNTRNLRQLASRIEHFMNTYEKRRWVAWNYADAHTYRLLKEHYSTDLVGFYPHPSYQQFLSGIE